MFDHIISISIFALTECSLWAAVISKPWHRTWAEFIFEFLSERNLTTSEVASTTTIFLKKKEPHNAPYKQLHELKANAINHQGKSILGPLL